MYEYEDPYGQGALGFTAEAEDDQAETIKHLTEAMQGRRHIVIECGILQVQGQVTKAQVKGARTAFHLILDNARFTRRNTLDIEAA